MTYRMGLVGLWLPLEAGPNVAQQLLVSLPFGRTKAPSKKLRYDMIEFT